MSTDKQHFCIIDIMSNKYEGFGTTRVDYGVMKTRSLSITAAMYGVVLVQRIIGKPGFDPFYSTASVNLGRGRRGRPALGNEMFSYASTN